MTEETANVALAVLDELRKYKGEFSEAYIDCCTFFEGICWLETNEYLKVFYNPEIEQHELIHDKSHID